MSASDRDLSLRAVQARIFRLGEEPANDDLSAVTTAEERLAMVAELSQRMWKLTGKATPSYTRATMPVRVLRRG
jgi:hypothetical protein